ncbi:MAG TPA: outer membrane beta-barrel family protein [Mucilaginibacter sp.]|nr:outer membrane beta-barrel family protein [Mucilaginibacter sp.]
MKPTLLKIYYMLLLFFVTTGVALAQTSAQPGHVSGSLLDEQGKPMMYATVSLVNAQDSAVVKGAISNEQGIYTFDHVKNGKYIVRASSIGYEKALSQPFSLNQSKEDVNLPQLNMKPNAHSLGSVTVTAAKPLIERKTDRVVMNVENSVLAAGNSAMDILERAPGVEVDKDDNISLKGKQGVTVMINDKLTYLTSAQLATLLRSTDGNTIQSIEIISNPSAKYDAAGNSGIINIKLKKNKQTGTNGSITTGVGYGAYWKDNQTLQLNHKDGNLNVFGTFSHNDNKRIQNIGIKRVITDSVGGVTYFRQTAPLIEADHNNSYRLGADYDLSSKNTIGFLINGYFNSELDAINNHTYIGPNFTKADSTLHTVSAMHQTYHNFAVNLNDTYKIDTAGQQLNIDLDYSKFNNNALSQYITDYFMADGSIQHPESFLGNLTPSVIDIHTAKADYSNPLTKTLKMEAGIKLSDVKTDNNLTEKTIEADPYVSTNHFIYDEKIDAAYINFNKNYKNFSVQAGLRAEYTSSLAKGDSANVVSSIPRHYLDLFPSLFLDQTINDKNEINFSYSRRIDRPQYDNLNPFVFHLDPYTYQKGNPYLQPQYTNNFELNYTYNKNITLTLGYSHTANVITEVPGTDPATKVAFITQANLQEQNAWNVNLYAPYSITKWWEGNINATGFYLGFKSNNLEGGNLDRGQWAYNLRTTQTFTPVSGYKFELTGHYQSDLTYGLYDVKPRYSIDAGLSHSFDHKKLNVKLAVNDIFNTLRNDVNSNYQSTVLFITQKRESRITRLTLTYNFGNNKIHIREHQSGDDDLKQRVKGAN